MLRAMLPVSNSNGRRFLPPPSDLDVDSDFDDSMSSDNDSVSSLPTFSPNPSFSSLTSYDVSMRSASPVPSVWSVSSSLHANAYKLEYGRGVNNYSEVYRLPADEEEYERLDKQHLMFKEVMGKYPPPMDEVMAAEYPSQEKSCLDLGCGSGSWIMDVARDYPNCNAVAVDLVPMQSTSLPPNCRSEVDDINLGLEHFYGDFDVVHARLISSGIRDYESLIDHAGRVLRPGGLLDIMEFGFHTYDVNRELIVLSTNETGPPWWPRWLAHTSNAVKERGGDFDAALHLHKWVLENEAYEEVVARDFWVPTSPWTKDSEYDRRIATHMRDDILAFLRSGRPLLLGSGLAEELVDELENKAAAELLEAKTPHWIRLQNVYARKKRQ